MAILQILAARLAGIDNLIYHTVDNSGSTAYQEGLDFFNKLLADNPEGSVALYLHKVYERGYEWGTPDGN